MIAEALSSLQHSTLLVSLALLAIMALRGPWLRAFGARAVMLLWLVVPGALLALFLPAPVRLVQGGAASTPAYSTTTPVPTMPDVFENTAAHFDISVLWLTLWLAGALFMTALLAVRQWRYRRSLGRLEALPDGGFRSQFTNAGPVLVGALRPRIVVPADFGRRYTSEQQALILAHERCHLKRGDAQLTLLACLLRCAFWFNPLVHLAWSRFRIDQELACDASVMRAHPEQRRAYAEAMLSTQFGVAQLPVGCTWLTGDPLRRRITMLYTRPPGKIQLLAGTVLALTASTAAAVGAWSSQEPQFRYLSADMPRLEIMTAAPAPAAPEPTFAPGAASISVPSLASISALHVPGVQARLAPPAPAEESTASHAPAAAASSAGTDASAPEAVRSPAPAAAPQPRADSTATVAVEHARLVEASRPGFPRAFNRPELVSYPGMPESEQPDADWQPDGMIWRMDVRVSLDENGQPVGAAIAENNLSSGGMARRYERLALRAVKDWRYEPARIDGDAVPSELILAFYFDTNIAALSPDDIEHPYRNGTTVFPRSVSRSFTRVNDLVVSR